MSSVWIAVFDRPQFQRQINLSFKQMSPNYSLLNDHERQYAQKKNDKK